MDGLMVSQLADRSGVPATTVRFYEQQGLLPARRSSSGYRLYDDTAVDRLAFIATAKGLGLPLEEIRTLLGPWAHGSCAQVQEELRPLLEHRIDEVGERMAELTRFGEHLRLARDELDTIERDGPCDPSCAFLGRAATPETQETSATPAIACRLDAGDLAERTERWREVLGDVTERAPAPGGVRLIFDARARAGVLAELAAAEADCCPFFELVVRIGPPLALDVAAPPEALPLVHALFGEPGG